MHRKFLHNAAGAVISILISLIAIPLYVRTIGTDRYGILALVWVLLGYFGVFDLGMSRSSTNALARVNENDVPKMGRIFATTLAINISLGMVGSIIIVFIGGRLLTLAHSLPLALTSEITGAMPWVALTLPLTLATGMSIGAFDAREKFLTSNALQIGSNALGLLVPLIVALFYNPRLPTIVASLFLTRLITTALMLSLNVRQLGTIKVLKFDRSCARSLLHFGGWITVTNMISPLMSVLDQFLVGGVLGASSVAYYSISVNSGTRLQLFSTTLSRTLFPLFSRESGSVAHKAAATALVRLSFLSMLVYAPVLAALEPLFSLWLGKSFAASASAIAPILFVGAWINGLAVIPFSLIQGQGRPDLVAKTHACEVVPYFIVLWFLVHRLGILGVALTWSARVIVDFVVLSALSRFQFRSAMQLFPSLVLVACGFAANLSIFGLSWFSKFAFGAALFFVGLIVWVAMDPDVRKMWWHLRARAYSN